MPLKDRTKRKLPRLGIIRLGYLEERKRSDGSTYTFPRQSDCFVLKDAPRLAAWFAEQEITKPRELDVILPFPTLRQNFDAYYSVWAKRVQLCKGDGEHVLYANPMKVTKDKKGTHVYQEPGPTLVVDGIAQVAFTWDERTFAPGDEVECPGSLALDATINVGYLHCAACRMSAVLKVTPYHPDLFDFGYYQISTGSWRNYATIMGTLEALPPIVFEKHLPFTLRMVQEQVVYTQPDGKRATTEKWFLHLQPHPDLLRALFERQAQELASGPIAPPPPQLAAPRIVQAEPDAPPPYAEEPADQLYPDDDVPPRPAIDPNDPPDGWPTEEPPGGPYVEGEWTSEGSPPKETIDAAPPQVTHTVDEPPPEPKVTGRPYDPETLRRRIASVAATKRHRAKPSITMVGLCRALYKQVWGDNTSQFLPHALEYLVGHKTLEECHGKQVGAMIDWLKDTKLSTSGHSVVSTDAVVEANRVARLVVEQEGQQTLPGC